MVKYCPACGHETEQDSIYCLNCGKKLPERRFAPPSTSWDTPPQPDRPPAYQAPGYRPVYQSRPYHPSMKAPLGERCIALIIDDFISQFTCGIYGCFKDGIRDGQAIGKGLLNLRVIDYNSGMPADYGQSCVRNCLCGWLDACTCYLVALTSEDGRRIGDHIAGTVVILDR